MSGLLLLAFAPIYIVFWRRELVNLVADCIAEGISRSRNQ